MKHDYTFYILKYIYKELSLTDQLEVEFAIQDDENWKAEYDLLHDVLHRFPKVAFFPKHAVVKKILKYSARTTA